jgi:hypothetical protein
VVLADQQTITDAIKATADAYGQESGVNSLIRLLALSGPARIPAEPANLSDARLQVVLAELQALRTDMRSVQFGMDTRVASPGPKVSSSTLRRRLQLLMDPAIRNRVLDVMPVSARHVIEVAVELQGRSLREIADLLGMPLAEVDGYLQLAAGFAETFLLNELKDAPPQRVMQLRGQQLMTPAPRKPEE